MLQKFNRLTGALLLLSASTAWAQQQVIQSGNLTRGLNNVIVSERLEFQVCALGSVSSAFAGSCIPATPGNAFTLMRVNGQTYGSDALSGDVGAFTLISQSTVSGSGTVTDPRIVTTVVEAGDTGVQLQEVNSFIDGNSYYTTQFTVLNQTVSPANVTIFKYMDCTVAGNDAGYGLQRDSGVYCTAQANSGLGGFYDGFVPTDSTNTRFYEDFFGSVISLIIGGGTLPNTVQVNTQTDNGMALSWDLAVPPNGTATASGTTGSFRPQIDVRITVQQSSVLPGGKISYTVTASNTNSVDLTLDNLSITLPAGFSYVPGSTSGLGLADPTVNASSASLASNAYRIKAQQTGAGGQTLTFSGPITVPANSSSPMTFAAAVSPTAAWARVSATVAGNSASSIVDFSDNAAPVVVGTSSIIASGDPNQLPLNVRGVPLDAPWMLLSLMGLIGATVARRGRRKL